MLYPSMLTLEAAADTVSVQGGINQAEADSKQRDTDQETNCLLEMQLQKNNLITLKEELIPWPATPLLAEQVWM